VNYWSPKTVIMSGCVPNIVLGAVEDDTTSRSLNIVYIDNNAPSLQSANGRLRP